MVVLATYELRQKIQKFFWQGYWIVVASELFGTNDSVFAETKSLLCRVSTVCRAV